MKTATRKRLPRLAVIAKRYIGIVTNPEIEFSERSRMKGTLLKQMEREVERIERRRAGSTLTEVLVALMIMSIGLVSVAVLFPAAVLRGVSAHKLTKATDLRLNVDGSLATYPWIVHDPNQSGNPASHFSEVFAFDPLGAAMLQPALAATFGNNGSGAPAGSLKRYRGTWTTEASASSLVASADDWNLLTEAICTNVGPNQFVTIPVDVSINPAGFVNVLQGAAQVDIPGLSPFALPTKPAYRAVLFNLDQTAAQTRILSSISGDTVSWATPLPLGFVPVNTRIESQDRRYTWLLTVRMNGAGDAMTDVVVLFNRSFDPADEILFPATFNVNNQPVAITCPADRLRKGAYVFDADNGWWYRIANAANGSITLDVPAAASSPATGGKAMLLRNVVDVYPIGVK